LALGTARLERARLKAFDDEAMLRFVMAMHRQAELISNRPTGGFFARMRLPQTDADSIVGETTERICRHGAAKREIRMVNFLFANYTLNVLICCFLVLQPPLPLQLFLPLHPLSLDAQPP
jgi:hypothetical protein